MVYKASLRQQFEERQIDAGIYAADCERFDLIEEAHNRRIMRVLWDTWRVEPRPAFRARLRRDIIAHARFMRKDRTIENPRHQRIRVLVRAMKMPPQRAG